MGWDARRHHSAKDCGGPKYQGGLEDDPIDQVKGVVGCEGSSDPGVNKLVSITM